MLRGSARRVSTARSSRFGRPARGLHGARRRGGAVAYHVNALTLLLPRRASRWPTRQPRRARFSRLGSPPRASPPPPSSALERGLLDALFALGAKGCELLWGVVQQEREAWLDKQRAWLDKQRLLEREREAWGRECEREREAWLDKQRSLEREREAWERERALLLECERAAAAQLQYKLDVALGHTTVRTVLEQIVVAAFPRKNITDALKSFCDDPAFLAYLDLVSEATSFQRVALVKSAKGAYSMLSDTIHNGSTLSEASDVPQAVLRDKCMLYAVSAIFKFGRRDVRFYLDNPRDALNVPSPARSPLASPAASAVGTPPKAANQAGAEVEGALL